MPRELRPLSTCASAAAREPATARHQLLPCMTSAGRPGCQRTARGPGQRRRDQAESPDAPGPELDADAGPRRAGGLGDRVFPGALATAAHDDEVAVAEVVAERAAAAAAGPQQQGAGEADRQDGHHGVLRAAAADGVAVPGHAVAAVAVVAQPGGGEGLAQLVAVMLVESAPGLGEHGVRQFLALVVEL